MLHVLRLSGINAVFRFLRVAEGARTEAVMAKDLSEFGGAYVWRKRPAPHRNVTISSRCEQYTRLNCFR